LKSQLPSALIRSLEGLPGFNKDSFEEIHAQMNEPVSVRLNPGKNIFNEKDKKELIEPAYYTLSQKSLYEKIPWSTQGFYLKERPLFTADPLFHAGAYYVQEASGMFLEQAMIQTIDLSRPLKVLDLCAAPGGKSTLIQSLISSDSLLLSNEVIKSRVGSLLENLIKWGGGNVVVTQNDPAAFSKLENYFDLMVVDAPCSGSGLFRRDPEAITEWSVEQVKMCSLRQQRILADTLSALKANGILIYSTCSFSLEENESIVDWLIRDCGLESVPLSLKSEWNIVESRSREHDGWGYRFYPDRLKGEGLFLACLRKTGSHKRNRGRIPKLHLDSPEKKDRMILLDWIREDSTMDLFMREDQVYAIPFSWKFDLPILQKYFYVRKAGILLGKITPRELIPHHEFAMSPLCSEKIKRMSLSLEGAIQYLKREEINLSSGEKGWALVQFENINLGWLKNLGNRINNYYPMEWRIHMKISKPA
jgi:16S rRNA C967 or C1407 C5-methylase (RsmB/RsmF family)/NOL1/NOP2/fmu family ribosome biogenesis protein